jgi:hypothetical protein
MRNDTWISIEVYTDRVLADAALGLLGAEGVPCYVASNEFVPGLGSAFSVRVPAGLIGQARLVLDRAPVSDAELTELALIASPQEPPENRAVRNSRASFPPTVHWSGRKRRSAASIIAAHGRSAEAFKGPPRESLRCLRQPCSRRTYSP